MYDSTDVSVLCLTCHQQIDHEIYMLNAVYCLIQLSSSYTMGCPHVRGDNPRALASGLSYVQVDNPWYNYFIPPSSV